MQNLNINPNYFVLPMFSLSQEVFISLGINHMTLVFLCLLFVSCNTFQFLLLCMIIHPGFSHRQLTAFLKNSLIFSSQGVSDYALLFRKESQEPCHTCPSGRPRLQHSLLCPQKNGRSGGNRARLITWEQIPLTTSRGNLTLTSSRNTAISPRTHQLHRPLFQILSV